MLEKTEREIKNGQSRDTGNIGYTRHMTKTNKKHTHTSQKTKTRSNTEPTKTPGVKDMLTIQTVHKSIQYSFCTNSILYDYYKCDII